VPTRARWIPLLLALLLPGLAQAAPGAARADARIHAFLRRHPAARLEVVAAPATPPVAAEGDHRKLCTSPHPPASAGAPVLASMRAVVAETATMKEDWRVFFTLYHHAEAVLAAPAYAPAGLCAALRGGLDGANETSTYASAAAVLLETYTTLLAVPHLFLGEPRVALIRGLQLHRDAARDLDPPDDRRRALKYSLYSYALCPDLVPSKPLAWAMYGLGAASIIPHLADAARALDAASAAVATLGDDPLATAYTLGLEAARAAELTETRFWLPYMLIDRVLQTGEVPAAQAEALEVAHDKAFQALETEEGVAVMTAVLAEFAAPGRARAD